MHFGKTTQEKIKAMILGGWKYAWLPVKLDDGSWVWLQEYFEHYQGARGHIYSDGSGGKYFLYETDLGGPFGPSEVIRKRFHTSPDKEYAKRYMAGLVEDMSFFDSKYLTQG